MQQPFTAERVGRRHRPGRAERAVQVWLPEPEREILIGLLQQLDQLLDDGSAGDRPLDPLEALTGMVGHDAPARTPADPALARLLPDGHRDDPDLAAEYRRLTEFDLRSRKRSAARAAAEALGRSEPVLLQPAEAVQLLRSLTDLRLVLGERLELRTDADAELLHLRLHGSAPIDPINPISADGGDDVTGDRTPDEWVTTATIYEVLTAWQESLVAAVSAVSRAGS